MKNTKLIFLAYLFWTISHAFALQQDNSTNVFFIKEENTKIKIEKIEISENQVQVFNDPAIITFILPLSEGLSGDLVFKKVRDRKIVIQNINGELKVKTITSNGEKNLPGIRIKDLKKYYVKVNVSTGDGKKILYEIKNNNSFEEVDGPVVDIFRGTIPMQPGDYSITIETSIKQDQIYLGGEVPYETIDNWIVCEIELPNGKNGKFIVDCGASTSVIKKEFLPDGAEIIPVIANEYSSESTKSKKGTMQGASGKIRDDNFLGQYTFNNTQLGTISIPTWTVNVINDLPPFLEKYNFAGILGLNVLRMAKIVEINNLDKSENGKMIFKENLRALNNQIVVPFRVSRKLLVTPGSINGNKFNWLIDTGARRSIINSNFISKNDIHYDTLNEKAEPVMGLGGNEVIAEWISIENTLIADNNFNALKFVKSEPALFRNIEIENTYGLLGIDFFRNFNNVLFDFENQNIILAK